MTTILVAGPPCAGKTTFVRAHMRPGDEVVDYDQLTGPDRSRRWRQMVDAPLDPGRTRWVIWTAPRRQDRGRFRSQHQAQVVVVWAPMATCLERAKAERPPLWASRYVPEWFQAWEPSRSGAERVVSGV